MSKPRLRKIKESSFWACDGIAGTSPKAAYYAWASVMTRDEVVEPILGTARTVKLPTLPRVASFEG